jgi:ribose 5-phosphate isomerase B
MILAFSGYPIMPGLTDRFQIFRSRVLHGITFLSTAWLLDPFRREYLWGMRIAIGSDHAGFRLKEQLIRHLGTEGHSVLDEGTHSEDSTDYPAYAHTVSKAVVAKEADLGVVVCGSGNGVNITANKHAGIRSALAWIPEVARLARQHNDANVLALPARFITAEEAMAILDAFLEARFEGGRHQRRVAAIEG